MNLSDNGKAFIKAREALRLEAYQDEGGVWTIGWGHTVGVKQGDACTMAQALEWFDQDAAPKEQCVTELVTVPLTQDQFDALVSFVFNLGCSALRNSHLLRYLNAGDYVSASAEFARWNHVDGQVSAGLSKRRQDEADLFLLA